MHQILVYADSLSWGIVPTTRQRLDFDRRWPGVMENALNGDRRRVRVIEDCLNGRRTVPIARARQCGIRDGLQSRALPQPTRRYCHGAQAPDHPVVARR